MLSGEPKSKQTWMHSFAKRSLSLVSLENEHYGYIPLK